MDRWRRTGGRLVCYVCVSLLCGSTCSCMRKPGRLRASVELDARHVLGTGFWNGASTLKQHFVLPKNGSKYYLKYKFLVFPVLVIFSLSTSLFDALALVGTIAFGSLPLEILYFPSSVMSRDVPLAKNPSTGTAQQRLFLVLKVVLHAVVVISEVLRLSTKSRCSRCCRHISSRERSRRDVDIVIPWWR